MKLNFDKVHYNEIRNVLNDVNIALWDSLTETQKKGVQSSLIIIYSRLGYLPELEELNGAVYSILSDKGFVKFL